MRNQNRRFGAVTFILCLLLAPGVHLAAQDEPPGAVPFSSIAGDGTVSITVAGGDVYYRLGFDADLRLGPQSDGIHQGDDVQIITSMAYLVPPDPEQFSLLANPLGLPIARLVVRLTIAGQCFEPRGRALLYRAPDGGAIAGCAEVGIEILDEAGNGIVAENLDILQAVTVELAPAGRRGRWKLRSIARFSDPGFPFPVVGYTYDAAGNRLTSGVTLVVGNDAGLSPFRVVGFRTLAP